MKLALLSGASPKTCKEGPVVLLPPGSWRLHLHGLVDSKLSMRVEGYDCWNEIHDKFLMSNEGPEAIQLMFSVRGSENYITAFAERQNAA